MEVKRNLVVAVLLTFCLTVALFTMIPTWSSPSTTNSGEYNPWADYNDDGIIDIFDIVPAALAFGTSGTPLTKGSIYYDSGWLNITDKAGQNITIVHNLNSADLIVDITGKTTIDGGSHQRHLGLTYHTLGWSKTYGTANPEVARSMIRTDDGGYAMVGYRYPISPGTNDFWLVKTDADGNMQWNNTYGGASYEDAYSIVKTSDGGYAVVGFTMSFGAGGFDFFLVKTDSNGNEQWNKTYGGANDDIAYCVIQTSDGGYAIAGQTQSFGAGFNDFWLVKTDANGNEQWNKTYGGMGYDEAPSLVQTADGGYSLAGRTTSFGTGSSDFWLIKTCIESGLAWIDSAPNSIILYRGATDPYWNFVRVRLWKPK